MEVEKIINMLLALVFVVALMGILALLAKKFGLNNAKGAQGKRLKIVEILTIDSKRKAAILQCDQKQHLVILSQNGETVIDKEIPLPTEQTEQKDVKPFE